MFCENCGKQIEDDAKFCEHCGAAISEEMGTVEKTTATVSVTKKSKKKPIIIAVVSAFVFFIVAIVAYSSYEWFKEKQMSKEIDSHSIFNSDNESKPEDTTKPTAKITTQKVTTTPIATTKTTTTVAKKQEKIKASEKYMAYFRAIKVLNNFIREEGIDADDVMYYNYYLYDINHDGTYELILQFGEYEAETEIMISTIDESSENGVAGLCEMPGGHIMLVEKDGKLYTNYRHASYQVVEEIKMNGLNSASHEVVFEGEVSGDYNDYGTAIKCYRMSDLSGIEALCPKELLENRPSISAYTETYSLPKFGDSEIHLYVDGDFSYITVQVLSDDFDYGIPMETYTKDECKDYVTISFNALSAPYPVYLSIVPFSELNDVGDVVICNVSKTSIGTAEYCEVTSVDKKGQINCHGGTVAGFTTDYVVNGGAVGKVRNSLGDTWHITAKNACDNYGVTWYELWDSDDGDYYGWVDSNYIDFY